MLTTFLAMCSVLAPSVALPAQASGGSLRRWPARASSSVKVDDKAQLQMRRYAGSVLIEEGTASGSVPGRTWVRMVVGKSIQASFTIWSAGGSIGGSALASLHSSSRYTSFSGQLSVSRGSGRYVHAHGGGRIYGVLDRRTHDLTVQTVGTLYY